MRATRALRNAAMSLLAADATLLAPAADAIYVGLVMNDIAPSEATVFADIVLATFDGHAELAVGVGTQPEGFDPATDDSIIDLKSPAGGFRWETTGVTNLPQTIYGYVLLDHAKTLVLAAESLPTPIVLTAADQRIDLGEVSLRLPANSIS